MNSDRPLGDRRVLLLAPTARDGDVSRRLLAAAGIECVICPGLGPVCDEIAAGVGVLVLPEEVVMADDAGCLTAAFRGQPVWSDLPVVVLSRAGADSMAAEKAVTTLGNVSIVERPVRVSTLLSVVRAALRARERQYEVRDHLLAQQQTAAALRESEERFRAAFDQAVVGAVLADLRGKILRANDAYCRIVGYPREEIIDRDSRHYTHPDDRALNAGHILRAEEGESRSTVYEKRYVRQDGRVIWAQVNLAAACDETGKPVNLVALVEDVTARKQAVEALRTSEERFALAVDAAELGTFYCPLPLGTVVWNDKCKEHFWLPLGAAVDIDLFYSILHPDDRDPTRRAIERALSDHAGYDVEYRTVAPDGRFRWIRAKGRAYYDVAGSPARFDGVTLDISDQKRAEEKLREGEERLRLAVTTGRLGVWDLDLRTGVMDSSDRCKANYGRPADAPFTYADLWGAIHADDRDRVREAVRRAVDDGAEYDVEYRTVWPDRTGHWVLVRGLTAYAPDGTPARMTGVSLDITDRKAGEERRAALLDAERTARAEAERASRMKDEFLATLSHELRTPLNAVLGWAQILRHGPPDPEELAQGLDVIERNARSQAQIIEDLLDMSRIISGKVHLDVRAADLAAVVAAAVETVRPAAAAKGVSLVVAPFPPDSRIAGDPDRLQQVFWNLLSNAVKFTPGGGAVAVTTRRTDSGLEVEITDTGEGIAADFLPHVFDRFRQADATTTRRHGGLGLGLSIVKQVVELHGGTVSAASGGRGRGAAFTVTMPVGAAGSAADPGPSARARPADGRARPAAGRRLTGLKVLVVDDEADARALLRRLLEDRGAGVTVAASAADALRAIAATRPDVLVSDIGMPGEDGYALIRRVRALPPAAGGGLPAVALTAYARPEDRAKALAAGFQSHLAKPVEPNDLVAAVAGVATGRSS